MIKRFLSVILTMSVLLMMTPVWGMAANSAGNSGEVMPLALTAENFTKGDGTPGSPYEIETAGQLKKLADDTSLWGKCFKLTADIDLGENTNGSWSPIGNGTTYFTGTFDGGGHLISGLYISINDVNNSKDDYRGLFGYIGSGGTVKNLGVNGFVSITSGRDTYVGGIAGKNSGTIENCYNACDIFSRTGGYYYIALAGGIAGENSGTIENCYNTGDVTTMVNNKTGHLAGGIVGNNSSGGTVKYCYDFGNVSLSNGSASDYYGGIAGQTDGDNVTNCYYLSTAAKKGIGNLASGTDTTAGITAAEFAQQSTFSGWSFNAVWRMSSFCGRPILVSASEGELKGGGSVDDPYLIKTAEDLVLFSKLVNFGNKFEGKYIELTGSIDLSSVCGEGIGSWTPIGCIKDYYKGSAYTIKQNRYFSGIFDGGGHRISGLYINADTGYQGLFGYVVGTVKNLAVDGSVTGAGIYVGGIAGYFSGTVQNCCYTGTVSGSKSYVGGIVGYNNYSSGKITNCYNTGTVIGDVNYVGGITGYNTGNLTNCYNTGIVRGNGNYVGGIAGDHDSFGGRYKVTNCYNTGAVSGSEKVGGIAGHTDTVSGVANCYYLSEEETGGINGNDTATVRFMTEQQFNSGEVAWLLQNGQTDKNILAWGQQLKNTPKDNYPVLTTDIDKKVYKVAFISGETEQGKYTYYKGTVTLPAEPSYDTEKYVFRGWKIGGVSGTEFTAVTQITEDTNVYAVVEEKYAGEQDTIKIDLIVGYAEQTIDLRQYIQFAVTSTTDSDVDFTLTNDGGLTGASVSGSDLVITAGAAKGTYDLTVNAAVNPKISTLSFGSYGTESPITLNITVTVSKISRENAPNAADVEIKKTKDSITVTAPDNTDGEYQFSKDGGATWQDSNEFTGLEPGETYEITVRYKESENYEASEGCTPKNVTTVDSNGDTTLLDGETVETTGGTVTNKDGNITITDGNDVTTVSPIPDEGTEVDKDGNVTAPKDSKVKRSGAPEMTLPDGGVVGSDGSVTVPEGGSVQIGSTVDIVPPAGEAVKPNDDRSVVVPDGSLVTPPNGPQINIGENNDETIVDVDGNITFPNGGDAEIGDSNINVPRGGKLEPQNDGTVYVPEGTTVTGSDGYEATAPEGGAIYDPVTGRLQLAHTVKFNSRGGSEIADEKVADGKRAARPEDPTRSGYTFGGWYTDEDCTEEYDFTRPVTSDIELFAKWTETEDDPSTGDSSGGTSQPSTGTIPPSTPSTGDNSDPTDGDTNDPSGDNTEPSDGNNAGNVNVDFASGENAPNVSISEETSSKLKEEIIAEHLTPEEKAAVANGDNLDIILVVEDAGESVPAADKQAIEAVLTNTEYTIGMYLNIDLIKLINGQQVGKITELNTPIRVTIEIPEDLRSANREFVLVRVHNGVAEILEDVDGDPDTITIVTDKFSTYSIAYQDTDANPNTGTTTPIAILAISCAVIVAAVAVKRKKITE